MTAAVTDQQVREHAAKAAAELRRRGWMQNDMVDIELPFGLTDEEYEDAFLKAAETCRVCALGAVKAASGDLSNIDNSILTPLELHVASRFADAVGEEMDAEPGAHPRHVVPRFNDERGRTEGEVLAIFDAIVAGSA